MSEKITIHRALAELKIIDDRIERAINGLVMVDLKQDDRLVNSLQKESDFKERAKSGYQSVTDLIKRKMEIKMAIMRSNAKTEVELGGKKYMVADVIAMREIIDNKKALLSKMKTHLTRVKGQLDNKNMQEDSKALELAKFSLQRDNVKLTDQDAIRVTESFLAKNRFHFVDPVKIETKIASLSFEIDTFVLNIDAVLSEANAITSIDI